MGSSRAPYLAVVRRGDTKVYRFLKEHFEALGLVEVIWDRRVATRRTSRHADVVEHRRGERRGPTPETWSLGFVLVPRQNDAPPTP